MDKSPKTFSRRLAIKSLGATGIAITAGVIGGGSLLELQLAAPAKAEEPTQTPFKGYYVFASDPRAKLPGYVSMPG